LPEEIDASPFGPRLQAAIVTLTARHRISRRAIAELARDLFGVTLSTGAADAICHRASDALAGPTASRSPRRRLAIRVRVVARAWSSKTTDEVEVCGPG
jgi:transposase